MTIMHAPKSRNEAASALRGSIATAPRKSWRRRQVERLAGVLHAARRTPVCNMGAAAHAYFMKLDADAAAAEYTVEAAGDFRPQSTRDLLAGRGDENGIVARYIDEEGCPTEVITMAERERREQAMYDARRPVRSASCPEWCETPHNEQDPTDTAHASEIAEIHLIHDETPSRYEPTPDDCLTVVAQMVTGYCPDPDERLIQLSHDSTREWVELTMDEAEELGLFLLQMVTASRKS